MMKIKTINLKKKCSKKFEISKKKNLFIIIIIKN